MRTCQLCQEPADGPVVDDDVVVVRPDDVQPLGIGVAHRACLLRNVLGGIGHLTDHARWCGQEGDPDAGLTYHESALRVWAWVQLRGVPAT